MWVAAKFALSGILGPAWLAKLFGIGAALLALGSVYLVWKHKIYMEGWNDHVQIIAEENAAALTKQREVLSGVRGCKSSGLRYDQTTGKCGGKL